MEPVGAHKRLRGNFTLTVLAPLKQVKLCERGARNEDRNSSRNATKEFHGDGAHPAEDRRNCIRGVRRMEPVGVHRRPRESLTVAR